MAKKPRKTGRQVNDSPEKAYQTEERDLVRRRVAMSVDMDPSLAVPPPKTRKNGK